MEKVKILETGNELKKYEIEYVGRIEHLKGIVEAANKEQALAMIFTGKKDRGNFFNYMKNIDIDKWLNDNKKELEIFERRAVCEILAENKDETKKEIFDAEALLYEMDANNVDEISIKESGKITIYTREQIERYLELNNA